MRFRFLGSVTIALALVGTGGCEKVFGTTPENPSRVSDLRVAATAAGGATLAWTSVNDGSGKPATYMVFSGAPAPAWTGIPVGGTIVSAASVIGDTMEFVVDGLNRASEYSAYVVAVRVDDDSVFASNPSAVVSFVTDAGDLEVVASAALSFRSSNSLRLEWTEVDDGAGNPANYLVAFNSPTVNWATDSASAVVVLGKSIGAVASFTAEDLAPATQYQFQVASTRGREESGSLVVTTPTAPVTGVTESPPAALPFFEDNFDNGLRNNANGFTWGSTGARVVVSSDRAFSGTHAIRFRFGPDTLKQDSFAEQRFNLGQYLAEYWVDYQLYIPANYVHRYDFPTNNKFFVTWRDTYSDVAGGTWRIGYEYQTTTTGSQNSFIRTMSSRWDFNSWTDGALNHPQNGAPFIGGAGPMKIGQWNRVRLQFKAASSRTASDGIMRMWINDALYAEMTNGKFHNFFATPADAVLRNGYFLGWSNSGFAEVTDFFIDDVKFYKVNPGW